MLRTLPRTLSAIAVVALIIAPLVVQAEQLKLGKLVESNIKSVSKLSVGMSKADVVKTMGTNTAKTNDGVIENPWTTESFTGRDGGKYEVLYYVTRKNPPFTPIGKFLTTPVVLKAGKVSGWGNEALEKVQPKSN